MIRGSVRFGSSTTSPTRGIEGVPFALRDWQESFVRRLFGTIRPDGRRQYRKVFCGIPRKQGKTELGVRSSIIYCWGRGRRASDLLGFGDREQASLIYRAAATMVRNDPALDAVCLCYEGYKRIVCEPLNSFFQALSSDAPRKYGFRPSAVLFDELHVFPNRKLFKRYNRLRRTLEPLTLMITTAGWDRTSLCYEQWKHAQGVRDGLIDDPAFLPLIYEAGQDEDWTSEEVWRRVMPALGDYCQLEFIREECRNAQELPAYRQHIPGSSTSTSGRSKRPDGSRSMPGSLAAAISPRQHSWARRATEGSTWA